jgi:general L-amino acid transport system permease protein
VPTDSARPPLWRNIKVLRIVAQVVTVLAIVLLANYFYSNLIDNLEAIGVSTNFDYLNNPAGFNIALSDFSPAQTVLDALLVGIKNTFAVAIIGVIFSTIIGVLVGVSRLSSNWLVSKLATIYVETIRNIPPLLIILFFFHILLALPRIQQASQPLNLAVISNREIGVPSVARGDSSGVYLVILLFALVIGSIVWAYRTHRSTATGVPHHRVLFGGGTFLVIALAGYWALGGPFTLSRPDLAETQLSVEGGLRMGAAYVGLTIALTIYTASHIAEIVRGSIQAVDWGQTEASRALAFSSFQRMRYIVLPQAARIAIPPVINQYLNLVKNSSLGVAVGYAEVTFVTKTVIGNANPAPQGILMLMASYLLFSISISIIVNILNRRLVLRAN